MSARAEEVSDGPKAIFSDAFIENLVGDWIVNRQIHGKVVQNSLRVEWVLNHQFLQLHMKDLTDPIELAFEYPDGPFFNTFSWAAANQGWTMRMESQTNTGKRDSSPLMKFDADRRSEVKGEPPAWRWGNK